MEFYDRTPCSTRSLVEHEQVVKVPAGSSGARGDVVVLPEVSNLLFSTQPVANAATRTGNGWEEGRVANSSEAIGRTHGGGIGGPVPTAS